MSKTHFRKVLKSDHLGSADLEDFIEEGRSLVFKLIQVKQELGVSVAGKKGSFNIAYLEGVKPLVLNATNCDTVKSFFPTPQFPNGSPFVEDWKDIEIELYIDNNVKMMGEVTSGVRVSRTKPVSNSGLEGKIKQAKDLTELNAIYASLSKKQQTDFTKFFTTRKTELKNVKTA